MDNSNVNNFEINQFRDKNHCVNCRFIFCFGILFFISGLVNLPIDGVGQTTIANEKPAILKAQTRKPVRKHRRVRRGIFSTSHRHHTRRYPARRIKLVVISKEISTAMSMTSPAGEVSAASDFSGGLNAFISAPKPAPKWNTAWECPPAGDATAPNSPSDPDLNRLKNRVDIGNFIRTDFATLRSLPAPPGSTRKKRSRWTQLQRDAIAPYEGTPLALEGYLALVDHQSGGRIEREESCNCHVADARFYDFHLWLLNAPGDSRDKALVVEVTPSVRAVHPGWTLLNLSRLARARQKVRVSGWLMFDQEHPEQIGKTRSTLWEIHPIIKIEYQNQNGTWTELR